MAQLCLDRSLGILFFCGGMYIRGYFMTKCILVAFLRRKVWLDCLCMAKRWLGQSGYVFVAKRLSMVILWRDIRWSFFAG